MIIHSSKNIGNAAPANSRSGSPSSCGEIRSVQAFSLVEVVLALGIISFAMTTLMALLPVGLTTLRDSIETTVRADVIRQVAGELQQTPFSQISGSTNCYFSDEGVPTNAGSSFFMVNYTVNNNVKLLQKQDNTDYVNASLKQVEIYFYTKQDQVRVPMQASYTNVVYIHDNGL